jgi:hypothetical protein
MRVLLLVTRVLFLDPGMELIAAGSVVTYFPSQGLDGRWNAEPGWGTWSQYAPACAYGRSSQSAVKRGLKRKQDGTNIEDEGTFHTEVGLEVFRGRAAASPGGAYLSKKGHVELRPEASPQWLLETMTRWQPYCGKGVSGAMRRLLHSKVELAEYGMVQGVIRAQKRQRSEGWEVNTSGGTSLGGGVWSESGDDFARSVDDCEMDSGTCFLGDLRTELYSDVPSVGYRGTDDFSVNGCARILEEAGSDAGGAHGDLPLPVVEKGGDGSGLFAVLSAEQLSWEQATFGQTLSDQTQCSRT